MTNSRDLANLGGGFIQAGGGVQRSVESKLQDVVSVKDFGVVGDGSNETTKIRDAITTSVGKTLYFPKGTYVVDSVLSFPNNLVITGDGAGTVIRQSSGQSGNLFYIGPSVSNITISNITLDGNWTACTSTEVANGIRIDDSSSIKINNVTIQNVSTDGINLKTAGPNSNRDILIEGCSFKNCGRNGVAVLAGKNIRVANNYFEQCGYANIDIEPNVLLAGGFVTVSGNVGFTAPLGHVWNQYSEGNSIVNNVYTNNKTKISGTQQASPTATTGNIILTDSTKTFITSGIVVGDTLASTTTGNTGFKVVSVDSETQLTIRRMYGAAVALGNGHTYTFFGERAAYGDWNSACSVFSANVARNVKTLGGTLTDTGGHGLLIEGCEKGSYNGNVLDSIANRGIWLSSSSKSSIVGNTVISTGSYGLYSNGESSTNCRIQGNRIEGSSGTTFGLGTTHVVDGLKNNSYIRVHRSADQTIPVTTNYTKVQFNSGGGTGSSQFDFVTNNRFTPTQPGIYQILYRATMETLTAGKFLRLTVEKSGSMIDYSQTYAPVTGQVSHMLHSTVYLNGTTDYIEFFVRHDDTAAQNLDGGSIHTTASILFISNG